MKNRILRTGLVLFMLIPTSIMLFGQEDGAADGLFSKSELKKLTALRDLIYHPADINRLPIHICFIQDGDKYVGFIIAGHAFHDICRRASMEVQTFLDSLNTKRNTLFTFGVGYDFGDSVTDLDYNDRLHEMEKTFQDLQEKDLTQVYVNHVQDSTFKKLLHKIQGNRELAYANMEKNNTVNRIIYRYTDINFPIPIPFYKEDSIISFTIKKADLGVIPDLRHYESNIIKETIDSLDIGMRVNDMAIRRLNDYSPTISYTGHLRDIFYPVTIYRGTKTETLSKAFVQFDLNKLIEKTDENTGVTRHFYSLDELKSLCRQGQTTISVTGSRGTTEYNTCNEAKRAETLMLIMNQQKEELIKRLRDNNQIYLKERGKLALLKQKLDKLVKKDSSNSQLAVDAFLRGWPFDAGDTAINAALEKWYNGRQRVWQHIIASRVEYGHRLTTKKSLIADSNNIAGIFQSDDVFFSVKEVGPNYFVTPYKMLGGDFVQIIDRKNRIAQFLSMNNYRLMKL